MITIEKVGDAIRFTFVGNDHYLNEGTIEVPINSLSLVTDDSGMAAFKKSSSNDVFVSATYQELGMTKAELEEFYKENMVGKVGSEITPEEVEEMIDEAVSGKLDTSAITTEITSASTDSQVPSAKLMYDVIDEIEDVTATALNSLNERLDEKQDQLIAGSGITISGNVISADAQEITVDPTLDSGSTNPVANSAITEAVTAKEYPIENTLSVKHFWNDEGMGAYNEIGALSSVKVPNSIFTSNPYMVYAFANNEDFMGDSCAFVATIADSAITSIELLNGSVSGITATYDNDYVYFNTDSASFSALSLNIVSVLDSDYKPSSLNDLRNEFRERALVSNAIGVIGNIPSEYTKESVKRIYDTLSNFEDVNPIAGLMTLKDPENDSTSKVGYGVLNYNTYNPLTDSVKSGSTNIIKYNALDFKSESNVLSFNKTVINKERLKSVMPQFTINKFSGGSTSTHTGQLMNGVGCMIIETNANATQTSNISISISTSENQSGSIEIRPPMGGDSLEVSFEFNNVGVNKTESTFVKGDSIMLDLRKDFNEIGDWTVTQTFTVDNFGNSDLVTAISFYDINDDMVIPIADVAQTVADGKYVKKDLMFDELSHKASNTDVNIYEYGSPSAVTISAKQSTTIRDFYGIEISSEIIGTEIFFIIRTDDAVGTYIDSIVFYTDGRIESKEFDYEGIPYYVNQELTKFENGKWNIYFCDGAKVNYASFSSSASGSAVVYKSMTVKPIKEAISGKQDTLSAGTGIEISGNVISATGGGSTYSAGTNISIDSANTINCTLPITATSNNSLIINASNTNSNITNTIVGGNDNDVKNTQYSFIFGQSNTLSGVTSRANIIGYANKSFNSDTFVGGTYNKALNHYETDFGVYNNSVSASTTFGDSGNTLFSVGVGTSNNARRNAFEIRQNGDIYINSGATDVNLQTVLDDFNTRLTNLETNIANILAQI